MMIAMEPGYWSNLPDGEYRTNVEILGDAQADDIVDLLRDIDDPETRKVKTAAIVAVHPLGTTTLRREMTAETTRAVTRRATDFVQARIARAAAVAFDCCDPDCRGRWTLRLGFEPNTFEIRCRVCDVLLLVLADDARGAA